MVSVYVLVISGTFFALMHPDTEVGEGTNVAHCVGEASEGGAVREVVTVPELARDFSQSWRKISCTGLHALLVFFVN